MDCETIKNICYKQIEALRALVSAVQLANCFVGGENDPCVSFGSDSYLQASLASVKSHIGLGLIGHGRTDLQTFVNRLDDYFSRHVAQGHAGSRDTMASIKSISAVLYRNLETLLTAPLNPEQRRIRRLLQEELKSELQEEQPHSHLSFPSYAQCVEQIKQLKIIEPMYNTHTMAIYPYNERTLPLFTGGSFFNAIPRSPQRALPPPPPVTPDTTPMPSDDEWMDYDESDYNADWMVDDRNDN